MAGTSEALAALREALEAAPARPPWMVYVGGKGTVCIRWRDHGRWPVVNAYPSHVVALLDYLQVADGHPLRAWIAANRSRLAWKGEADGTSE